MAASFEQLRAALANRYAVQREIGSGGMATVYLAEDLRHHRRVALKVLRPELAATLGPERFSREIQIAAQLQHPHILPLLDSGEADGALYYVMPFVDGESLRARMVREAELPVADLVRILSEVADALGYAHAQGVVHRDIKPENVMLAGRHALVTDFGVAKAVSEAQDGEQLTSVGMALGTPTYMAPEQAAADPRVDHRADLYALGVVGYEMLAGRPPFAGASPQATLAAHLTHTPTPITRLRPAVPAALAEVIMRCLAKQPADRWQSAPEIVDRLEAVRTPSGGTPSAERAQTRLVAAARRSRVPLVAGVVGAAAALGVVAVLALRNRPEAVLTLGRASQLTFDPGLEIDPALAPDGKLVAYVRGTPMASRLYVAQVGGGQPIAVTSATAHPQREPHWSPDGSRLLYRDRNSIFVVPALGGQPREVARGTPAAALVPPSMSWAPDGHRVLLSRGDTVVLANVETGAEQQRAVLDGMSPHSFAWSPDGSRIAFVSGNLDFSQGTSKFGNIGPSAIWVMPAVTGAPVRVTSAAALSVSPVWLPDGRHLLYVSNEDGPRDIYRVAISPGGQVEGRPTRLTYGLGAHSISLAADGKRLAYSTLSSHANVWRVQLPASGSISDSSARQVTVGNQSIEAIAVSPDGKWLYFDSNRSGNQDIFRMPVAGGEIQQLTTNPGDDFYPDVSPDGKEVVFHAVRERGRRAIVIVPAGGGAEQRVHIGSYQDRVGRWSHDGQALSFTVTEAPAPEAGLYVLRRTGAGTWGPPRRIFDDAVFGMWMPGDTTLLLNETPWTARGLNDGNLRLVPVGGGALRVLHTGLDSVRFHISAPIPNTALIGTKAELRDGTIGFWLVPAAGGKARLAVRFDNADRPSTRDEWASDGRYLYFVVMERESDVYVAELSTTARP